MSNFWVTNNNQANERHPPKSWYSADENDHIPDARLFRMLPFRIMQEDR